MPATRGDKTLQSSRAAHDTTEPEKHALDVENAAFTLHNDPAAAAGTAMVMGAAGKYVATDVLTPTEHTAIGDAAPHHAEVTLDANADTLFSLSTQALGLDTQVANTVLAGPASGAAAAPTFRALAAADVPHAVLSATHTDTTAAALVRGDLLVAIGASPLLTRYALSVPAANLMNVLGVVNGETEPTWKALLDETNPATLTVSAAAAPGTATTAAHRDHVHAITSSSNPGAAASLLASAPTTGLLTLAKLGLTDYVALWGSVLGGTYQYADLQSVTANTNTTLRIAPKGVGPNPAIQTAIELYGTDIHADGANYERMVVRAGSTYVIGVEKAGTGTLRPLNIKVGAYTFAFDTSGNLTVPSNIIMPDMGTVGQAAGPLLTFDDTNNRLMLAFFNRPYEFAWGQSGYLGLPYDGHIKWSADIYGGNAGDVGLGREGVGLLRVTDGSTGAGRLVSRLVPPAGTATASTAPLTFTSGTLLGTAEAGAVEFLTDNLHLTITTGTARKGIVLDDGTRLTSGKIPVATTNGRLIDLTAQAHQADAKANYAAGDLDTEAEIITAINAANATINSLLGKLEALGILAAA